MSERPPFKDFLAEIGAGKLPGHLGMEIVEADADTGRVVARMEVMPHHMAPIGFLHGGAVVALADTVCGYACGAKRPEGSTGFTTIELKANFLGTAREGAVRAEAIPVHLGRTTHVWDAAVIRESDQAVIAHFRCTQMILYPKA